MPSLAERAAGSLSLGFLRWVGGLLQRFPRGAAWLPVLLWISAIWWVSSWTPTSVATDFHAKQILTNFCHAPIFGVLALLACLCVERKDGWPVLDRRRVLRVMVFVGVYAVIDEVHQGFTPLRTPSVLDVVTDLVGAACTLRVIAYVGRADAQSGGLARRMVEGLALCAAAALAATLVPLAFPDAVWV